MNLGQYIIINYHYIRDSKIGESAFYPCRPDRFEEQVDYLLSRYEIVSPVEVYRAAIENRKGNFCAFTFDDGLSEHYEIVFPKLKRHNIVGAFFPIGMPIAEKRVPLTHKLHVVLSRLSVAELVNRLNKFSDGKYRVGNKTWVNPKRRFDDILTSNLKETLIAMPIAERGSFIESIFRDFYREEHTLASELFMNEQQVGELSKSGMLVGGHTFSHYSLETLPVEVQEQDIMRGNDVLSALVGGPPPVFSYPHGRYTKETLSVLERLGFNHAFILGAREVVRTDDRFEIPRYDANDLKI